MLRSILAITIFAGLAIFSGLASAANTSKDSLKIAFIDPLSGPFAATGQFELHTLNLVADEINQSGGINGHPVKIIPYDNQLNPKQSLVQLEKAINDGARYIVQGNGSSVASALLDSIDKYNRRNPKNPVLYLDHSAQDPSFTNERCSFWHFRFDSDVDMKTKLQTEWIAEQKQIKKVFLINQDYVFGHEAAKVAQQMIKEQRPDIEIMGSLFVPLGKVKDFGPYIFQVKRSGADALITASWGSDLTLLIRGMSDYGLNIPILTQYANIPGTVTAIGPKGAGNVYLLSYFNGDFDSPIQKSREEQLYKKAKVDYTAVQFGYMLHMLKKAASQADSVDPVKVAFALEGLSYDGPDGAMTMREDNHQILMPMFFSVLKDGMNPGLEGTHLGFHTVLAFDAQQSAMPTTCKMRRPKS